MKKGKKKITKILSVILSVLLFIGIVPVQVFAQVADTLEQAVSVSETETVSEEISTEDAQSEILYEVTEERDEYTKVYRKSDGSYTAMLSSQPLHYLQSGKWVDIDNTLTASGENSFTNTDNPLAVALPETLSSESGVTLTQNGYSMEFSLEQAQESGVVLQEASQPIADNGTPLAQEIKTQSETAVYADVFPETDLEYSISAKTVKENIVIQAPSAVRSTYSFSVSAQGLTAVCDESGAISFCTEDGSEAFFVPAPFMKDAAGNSSTEIAVSISGENGDYTLSYTPSAEWLTAAERQYPVTIDPAVTLADDLWYETVCVTSEQPDEGYYNDSLYMVANGLTYDEETGEIVSLDVSANTYVRLFMDKIGILTQGVTPTQVQLVLQGGGTNLAAYSVTTASDYTTMTYNTKPQQSAEPIDYYTGDYELVGNSELIHFDITKVFFQWLQGTNNYGVAINAYNNSLPASGLFLGEALSGGVMLLIDYAETMGYSEAYDYATQDVGRAGTSYLNTFSQELFIKRDDIAISGNIMPVSIAFMYNPALLGSLKSYVELLSELDGATVDIPAPYGNGWLTNYNRMLYMDFRYAFGETPESISYATENGSVVHFTVETDENGAYTFTQEEDSLADGSYELSFMPPDGYSGGLSPEYMQLKTPAGYTEKFDAQGRLVKIYKEKYPNQAVNIAYVSNMQSDNNLFAISSITDGAGRQYKFTYDSATGLLSSVQCYTASGSAINGGTTSTALKMEYTYDDAGNLIKAKYPDADYAKYEYDSINRLTTANSGDMYKLAYTYFDSQMHQVLDVTEYAQDISTLSGFVAGDYILLARTTPFDVFCSDSDSGFYDLIFNNQGQVVSITDFNGNYTNAETGGAYTISNNLLLNPSFEYDLLAWSLRNELPGISVAQGVGFAGDKAVKIDLAQLQGDYFAQAVNTGAGTYTCSAYVRAADDFSEPYRMMIYVEASDAQGNTLSANQRIIAATSSEYARYSFSLEAPENTAKVKVYFYGVDESGVFYVDAVQLEKGSGSGSFSQLENSSFADQSNGNLEAWQGSGSYTIGDEYIYNASYPAVSYPAAVNADYNLSQTVSINGKQGDILTFGGWVLADTVPNDPGCRLAEMYPEITDFRGDRFAGFAVTYEYTTTEDGETVTKTETVRKEAIPYVDVWQYVSESVQLKGDCTEVTFSFEYENHPDAVKMAMPSLVCEPGYGIDETAESVEEPLPDEAGETPVPEEAELCICGESCAYGPGCPCDCTDAETCDCDECQGCVCPDCTTLGCTCRCASADECTCPQCKKKFNITYDEYGNLLSVSIAGYDLEQLLQMILSRSYSANGNYLTTSTNESGGTVQYAYNQQNGALLSETDALGCVTEYTYNAIGALTQINTPVSDLAGLIQPTEMTTTYSYLHDQVVAIYHNGYGYYIDYDMWNNVDRIYAGAVAAAAGALLDTYVVDYTYGDDENFRRLESVQYGNGDTVHYRYDSYDRVTGISYDGGATYRFTYGYDSLGNLTFAYDSVEEYFAFYNETSVEIYRDDGLFYFASVDADGNLTEVVDGQFVYTTTSEPSQRNVETGVTTQKTTVSGEEASLELLKATDAFGRRQQQTTLLRDLTDTAETPSFAAVVTDYTYQTKQQNGTAIATGQVDTLQSRVTYGTAMAAENTQAQYGFAYEYDANGNITEEYAVATDGTRTLRYRYTYDEAQQMTRVDDNVLGKTHIYKYDRGGNRVSEEIYAYTLGTVSGTPQTINSTYGFSTDTLLQNLRGWNDLLLTYNGKEFVYDDAGNPISYNNGEYEYEWAGKQLTKFVAPDDSYTEFSYDANGIRTQKRQYKSDGTMEYYVDYYWQDGLLTQQMLHYYLEVTVQGVTTREEILISSKFVYDESNQPVGCVANGEAAYAFVRNLQGDIIAVVDQDGETLVEYSYDPWGKVTSTRNGENLTQLESSVIAVMCPFAYRGYNYDFSTGLYYLQSRYYNPEWGRFLNCDDTNILLATKGETLGANLFAYCNNNPVNRVDYEGRNSQIAFITYVVSLLGVIVAIDMACRDNLYDIFPAFTYFNMFDFTVSKSLIFRDFSFTINSKGNATLILVRASLRTEIGIKYFEGIFEIRTKKEWEYIARGGDFADLLVNFDNDFGPIFSVLPDILSLEAASAVTTFDFVRSFLEKKASNSHRGIYIRAELKAQSDYNTDVACILNWYCTYQRRKFLGKVINVNYIEHDCAEDYYDKYRQK